MMAAPAGIVHVWIAIVFDTISFGCLKRCALPADEIVMMVFEYKVLMEVVEISAYMFVCFKDVSIFMTMRVWERLSVAKN